mgnify:CR=1 FL=1
MALELFVDTISTTISLRVKNKPVRPSKALYDDDFLSYPRENSSSTYIHNSSSNYFSSTVFTNVAPEHYFDGYEPSYFFGYPFIMDILSINVKPYNMNTYSSDVYKMSTTSLVVPKLDSTSTYVSNVSKIYLPSTEDINVLTDEDNLELDYNLNRNIVEPIELQSVDENNGGGNGGDTSTLKEFWA